MKRPAILILSVGICTGVALASWIAEIGLLIAAATLLGLALLATQGRTTALIGTVGILGGFGLIHQHPLVPPDSVEQGYGVSTERRLEVAEVRSQRVERQQVVGRLSDRNLVIVTLPGFPEVRPGDHLTVEGPLKEPEPFDGFDYRSYLAAQGIHTTLYARSFEVTGRTDSWARRFDAMKRYLGSALTDQLTEPSGAFIEGILLGERTAIPEPLVEAFRRTGTSHVLALSGYNISIILGCVVAVLGRRPAMIALGIMLVIAFVCIVGPSPPVVRAAAMGSLLIISQALGRPAVAIQLCLVTAALTLLFAPWSLRYDVGWQLSFLATLGILIAARPLAGSLPRWMGRARNPLAVTLAAGLLTAPVIAVQFGTASLISPLANLVVVPLIPVLMALGVATALVGTVIPPMASLVAWPTDGLARLTLGIIGRLSRFEWASLTVSANLMPMTVGLMTAFAGVALFRLAGSSRET